MKHHHQCNSHQSSSSWSVSSFSLNPFEEEQRIIQEVETENENENTDAPTVLASTVLVQQQQQPISKVENIITMLENESFQYYIYDHPNITRTLYGQSLFQSSLKEKHVFFTFAEQLFVQKRIGFIMNKTDYEQFCNVTVAGVEDTVVWGRIPQHIKDIGYWDHTLTKLKNKPLSTRIFTNHGFSIQWMGAATDVEHKRVVFNKTIFDHKTNFFFYHTTRGTSVSNSTQFRHAPCLGKDMQHIKQPSSIGYDLPANEWLQQFRDSKFCLVIRGDMPGSRSMWRAIKSGCIPVIISDVMPYWAPIFRSMINLQDYTVMVDEFEFLQTPAMALNRAIANLTDHDIEQKIVALNLIQRFILPNETDSLFVEAFGHETLASFTHEYYDVSMKLYGHEHQVSLTF